MPAPTVVGDAARTVYSNPLSHTLGPDANYVFGGIYPIPGGNAGATPFTATRATVGAMTTLAESLWSDNFAGIGIFGQVNPTSGAQNFTTSVTAGSQQGRAILSLAGVDTADPVRGTAIANGNSAAPSVTIASDPNDIVVAWLWSLNGPTVTAGTDETIVTQYTEDFVTVCLISQPGASSVTIAPSLSASGSWGIAAASIKGTAAGGVAFRPYYITG